MKDEIYFDEEERNETEERLDEIYALKENMEIQYKTL